jgi:hypothetical protein
MRNEKGLSAMITHILLRQIFVAIAVVSVFTTSEISQITTHARSTTVAAHDVVVAANG